MATTAEEIVWLRWLLHDLGVVSHAPTPLHCDNTGAIQITLNHVKHSLSKHIGVDAFFLRDQYNKGILAPQFVPSEHQLADLFYVCKTGDLFHLTNATFEIVNHCSYIVWAAAIPGGGKQLDKDQTWTINVNVGTTGGRIWARTGCNFSNSGHGSCETGDCNGLLECQAYGNPPSTLVDFGLDINNLDYIDISLVDGFNVPVEFSPTNRCARGMIQCSADINGQCPAQLKTNGGCNNACGVFKTNEYCFNSGNYGPTNYSRFFKGFCPDAYSYPKDDQTSTFTCPGGATYKVVFCP
ncbi:protein P21-like [Dioscorea cayenensis subsp. rotundata]|uniref:Protein P21-like n=1 Tax=Dioscorea cayennensis subsp. rotundata TaxID=55577 RepID=A0AB40CDB8_DIOCR|nr:protein P21-like [Dioscorea cayenensis subsp. rotundata]